MTNTEPFKEVFDRWGKGPSAKEVAELPRFNPQPATPVQPAPEVVDKITDEIVYMKTVQHCVSVMLTPQFELDRLTDAARANRCCGAQLMDSTTEPSLGDKQLFCAVFGTKDHADNFVREVRGTSD